MIKPYVNFELAKELAERIFGLKVLEIKELNSYDDRTFHITKVSNSINNNHIKWLSEGYTLKITNTEKSAIPGHLDSILSTFEYLNDQGVKVPLPLLTRSKEKWVFEKIPLIHKTGSSENQTNEKPQGLCAIFLLSYISGRTVSSLQCSKRILFQWGELLAKFHNALKDFSNEVMFKKDVFWSPSHILEIKNLMEGLELDQCEIVLDVLRNFEELESTINSTTTGYIHGDLNDDNILAEEKSSSIIEINGVLDLEDMHYRSYVWDVGVMLAYVSMRECDNLTPIERMGHALLGYLKRRTLSKQEMSLLKICITSRLCQSLVMGNYTHRLNPENTYVLRSAKNDGWNILNSIWNTSNEVILEKWDDMLKTSI